MAKNRKNPAKQAASVQNAMKQEKFDAKADVGDFKKARAGPAGSAEVKAKSSAAKNGAPKAGL